MVSTLIYSAKSKEEPMRPKPSNVGMPKAPVKLPSEPPPFFIHRTLNPNFSASEFTRA